VNKSWFGPPKNVGYARNSAW